MSRVQKYLDKVDRSALTYVERVIRNKKELFIRNPYQDEEFYDLVEVVGITDNHELQRFGGFYVKTKHLVRAKLGVQAKYFWYRESQIMADIANIVAYHIYRTTNYDLNTKYNRKFRRQVRKAVRELKLSRREVKELLKEVINNKKEIMRLSNWAKKLS